MEEQTIKINTTIAVDRRDEAFHYLGFLIWPFGMMLDAFRHREKPWSKNVFWIFCIFFGYTFVIAKNDQSYKDSAKIAQLLIYYANADMSLGELFRSFYSESSNMVDIVQPLIIFLVSRVTDNSRVLFTILAVIFGYFYSRNIWYVLGHIKSNITIVLFVYLLTFALINPIWNINGFRMNVAAQIFLYGTLPYLLEGNRKKLIWSGVSVFFHFSFLVPVVILLLFVFLKNRMGIYLGLFILTAFIKEIDLQQVRSALSFLPPVFQTRVAGYTNLEYAAAVGNVYQSLSWFLPFSSKCITWVTYIMTLFICLFCRNILKGRKDLTTLLCFSLLLYSFANIFSLVPSGARFLSVAYSFMFPFFILFFLTADEIKGLPVIKGISVPFLLFFCMVAVRLGMEFYGLMTLFSNPLFATLIPETVPIIQGIKALF
jgi:hypothetical protein